MPGATAKSSLTNTPTKIDAGALSTLLMPDEVSEEPDHAALNHSPVEWRGRVEIGPAGPSVTSGFADLQIEQHVHARNAFAKKLVGDG